MLNPLEKQLYGALLAVFNRINIGELPEEKGGGMELNLQVQNALEEAENNMSEESTNLLVGQHVWIIAENSLDGPDASVFSTREVAEKSFNKLRNMLSYFHVEVNSDGSESWYTKGENFQAELFETVIY